MKLISLIDSCSQNIVTIDAESFILRVEIEGFSRELRLKPFIASILYELFRAHPYPLKYKTMIEILKEHGLIISDTTRMHRKLSEARKIVQKFYPSLGEVILNTRCVGYTLPLRFNNLDMMRQKPENTKFISPKIATAVQIVEGLVRDAIAITSKTSVVKHALGYAMQRDHIRPILVEKIAIFHECEKTILKEICMHEADFTMLRISYTLARIKTYVGLARISEYPISELQWLDWFSQEVLRGVEDLKMLIRSAERA